MTIDNRPRWKSAWNEEFPDEEEAFEDAREHIEYSDYEKRLGYSISHNILLQWAMTQDRFWTDFNETIREVERDYFRENYHEMSDEEIEYDLEREGYYEVEED